MEEALTPPPPRWWHKLVPTSLLPSVIDGLQEIEEMREENRLPLIRNIRRIAILVIGGFLLFAVLPGVLWAVGFPFGPMLFALILAGLALRAIKNLIGHFFSFETWTFRDYKVKRSIFQLIALVTGGAFGYFLLAAPLLSLIPTLSFLPAIVLSITASILAVCVCALLFQRLAKYLAAEFSRRTTGYSNPDKHLVSENIPEEAQRNLLQVALTFIDSFRRKAGILFNPKDPAHRFIAPYFEGFACGRERETLKEFVPDLRSGQFDRVIFCLSMPLESDNTRKLRILVELAPLPKGSPSNIPGFFIHGLSVSSASSSDLVYFEKPSEFIASLFRPQGSTRIAVLHVSNSPPINKAEEDAVVRILTPKAEAGGDSALLDGIVGKAYKAGPRREAGFATSYRALTFTGTKEEGLRHVKGRVRLPSGQHISIPEKRFAASKDEAVLGTALFSLMTAHVSPTPYCGFFQVPRAADAASTGVDARAAVV